ncbi:hypothetical protein Msil_2935 [Methylocella silvestris BL2]|uniref:Uncharacterized protein n=1 Tax=Methylocella silvestris (strain DSM 15510 / CIP 108128 / LMG 27833 / NCIMB 13906 / BL2) TaxID=395965 RepID=B8EIN4_METSB|nr:hypothetical protein Msil_2935 [Methylocella silvestris BL2]
MVQIHRALGAKIGSGEADGDILPPGDLALDAGPIARRPFAVDATAPGSVARFEIGAVVKAGDHTLGLGGRRFAMQHGCKSVENRVKKTNHRESLNQNARSRLHQFGRGRNC